MSMIKIEDLSVKYLEKIVLDKINLEIKKGEFCVISGPNGAGKTTLCKTLLGFLESNEGRIILENEDIANKKNVDLAKKISYVSQNINLDVDFEVYDMVSMSRYSYDKSFFSLSNEDKKIIEKYMKLTNSWELRYRKFNELSGGEKQRIIITRALVQDTDIIILDEPLTNLDVYYQIEFMDLLEYLNQTYGKTIITVLHDLNTTLQYANRVVFLDKGKIYFDGNSREILNKKMLYKLYNIRFDCGKIGENDCVQPIKNQFIFDERG